MENNNHVYVEKTGEIATLYFNRPDKRNALTHDMWKKIPQLLKEVDEDSAIKVLVLRGVDETSFAAGADISEFKTLRSTAEGAKIYNDATHVAERALAKFRKPTIAMVQSYCIGGGCELAAACDFRFADTNAKFGITPAKLGIVYGLDATKELVNLVGPSNAKYILFSGNIIDVDKAYHFGLVNEIHSPEEIEEKTYEFAQLLCTRAQFTIRSMKYIINEISSGVDEDTEETKRLRLVCFESDDYKEGVAAFMEKRKPVFKWS
ncbi:enoyl-CoA hydratase-related protein [Bacillus sp. PS06]|uniref:enoyl-CoA hydratase-related protein n=1 Tax=Bacillus sp. PS06 TaxID=2764176 RepID=UPI001785554B|nr:enoyl-CoA hydratase-related protein [Bacillus sp. PS06]MBD8067930.1 enoyl-CoA hydratase/isomerase family protein [Bacillus sp. PS06]